MISFFYPLSCVLFWVLVQLNPRHTPQNDKQQKPQTFKPDVCLSTMRKAVVLQSGLNTF
jgi:hypothetical protein